MTTDTGPTTATVRVLIADDHQIVRDALASYLSQRADITVVAAVGDADMVLAAYQEYRPDVVLCDFDFSEQSDAIDINGAQVISALREHDPAVKVLTITGHAGPKVITLALQAGATGFIRKSATWDEVATAILAVAAGRSYTDPISTQLLADVRSGDPAVVLSGREAQVLQFIAEGLTTPQIAEELVISPSTVKDHVDNTLRKLGASSRAAAVARAWELGLMGYTPSQAPTDT